MISYAQNFEDLMLWRALQNIDKGFYIDVGANDPDNNSVTKLFYEQGWRGINVEPVKAWYNKIIDARPNDFNLNLALGSEEGEITLYEIPETGLSTVDIQTAERHQHDNGYEFKPVNVKQSTLSRICEQYHRAPIHFLKIDVEGAEKSVLHGVDFDVIRPWIILVEATKPNTKDQNHHEWEYLLVSSEYEMVYFDGLNRFYISKEKSDLASVFNIPPNCLDNYELGRYVALEKRYFELQDQKRSQNELQANQFEIKTRELQNSLDISNQIIEELTFKQKSLEETKRQLVSDLENTNQIIKELTFKQKCLEKSKRQLVCDLENANQIIRLNKEQEKQKENTIHCLEGALRVANQLNKEQEKQQENTIHCLEDALRVANQHLDKGYETERKLIAQVKELNKGLNTAQDISAHAMLQLKNMDVLIGNFTASQQESQNVQRDNEILQDSLLKSQKQLSASLEHTQRLSQNVESLNENMQQMKRSWSWRITKILRWF